MVPPDAIPPQTCCSGDICAAWPTRDAVPRHLWEDLLCAATTNLDALGETASAILNDDRLRRLLDAQIDEGVQVRLFLPDDGSSSVRHLDPHTALTTSTRPAMVRRLDAGLPVSLLCSDDELLATHYLPGVCTIITPTYHVRCRSSAPGHRRGSPDHNPGGAGLGPSGQERPPPAHPDPTPGMDLFASYLEVCDVAWHLSTPV